MSAMFCHSHLTFHDPFCSFYCHSFSIKQMSLRHSRNRTATPTHIPIYVHTHKPTHYHTLTLTHVRGRTQTNSITIKSLIFYLQSPGIFCWSRQQNKANQSSGFEPQTAVTVHSGSMNVKLFSGDKISNSETQQQKRLMRSFLNEMFFFFLSISQHLHFHFLFSSTP